MDRRYWSIEYWRICLVLFIAFSAGMITGRWLICLTLSLIGYVGWLYFKLHQFNHWLSQGTHANDLSGSNGIWERFETRILDIQKKSKKRKKRTSKLLKRLQRIIKGLPYATIILNENNEIEWANEKARNYLNVDIKKDQRQRIDNLIRLPELVEMFNQNSDQEIETTLPHNNQRRLSVQYVPIQKDLKLILARDISDFINIQQMRKNFISNASHELRTPLTVISGYLEIMSEDQTLPQHLKPAVSHSSTQSLRMKNIIEDMLTLSRLERSELDEDSCTVIDVPSILHTICNDEIKIISDTHILQTQIDDQLHLNGVKSEIISVCSNLIQNAIQHTPDGTQIIIEWSKSADGEAVLTVKDNGPGIAKEHLAHLTERFYRADKGRSQDRGGTGLGLAIVQHIIQRHGGQLKISSVINKGSSFNVLFPTDKVVIAKLASKLTQ